MKKIVAFITIATLLPISTVAQHHVEKNKYLLQAPYEGLHGEIDSLTLTTYLVKESISIDALFQIKDGATKLDLMRDEVSEITSIAFDQNGQFTHRTESKTNHEGELELSSKWEVTRDDNSLPTNIIFRTPTDGTTTNFALVSRHDGKEVYRTPRQKDNATTNTRVEQVVEYQGDTIYTTIIYPIGYQTRYTYVYNDRGQNIYWTDKMEGEDNYIETILQYDHRGLLTQSERKRFDINTMEDNLTNDETISYTHYEFEESPTNHTPNWTHRVLVNQDDLPVAIEVQTIYYRK